jgi:hypothetical protein
MIIKVVKVQSEFLITFVPETKYEPGQPDRLPGFDLIDQSFNPIRL